MVTNDDINNKLQKFEITKASELTKDIQILFEKKNTLNKFVRMLNDFEGELSQLANNKDQSEAKIEIEKLISTFQEAAKKEDLNELSGLFAVLKTKVEEKNYLCFEYKRT